MNNGLTIPTESGYCDQPSIVKTAEGMWICSVTTSKGGEGSQGQYVNITRSADRGRTWSAPVAIEDPAWESAYSSLAIAPSGRIYCFYCYNLDHVDIRQVPLARFDMGGYYCFRYSEDSGASWSDRHIVPVRDFEIDDNQEEAYKSFNGKPLRFFWNVSRVFFVGDTCYSALIKYHYKQDDVLHSSEGVLLRCEELDKDPDNARWDTLPDGRVGLRTPPGGGRVAEEQSYVRLSDGTFFVTYRTIDGHPACSLSRDGGHTFETPAYMRYGDGRLMKHNRAATFIWPIGEGQYLYWFNNQGLHSYQRRNPIWCSLGTEVETPEGLTLSFSEPELLLYHDSEHVAMSYPDLLWDDGWYITETQKVEARIHAIDQRFMEKLRRQAGPEKESVYTWRRGDIPSALPEMVFSRGNHSAGGDHRELVGNGYTLALTFERAAPGETLFSTWTPDGGLRALLDEKGFLSVELGDCMASCTLHGSMPLAGGAHTVALIIDSRADVLYAVTDGLMDDGGDEQACGWRWMNRAIIGVPGSRPAVGSALTSVRLYDSALMTCEAARL